jgi:hypothetical protein
MTQTQATSPAEAVLKVEWDELLANNNVPRRDFSLTVSLYDVPECARVTVTQAHYHAWREPTVIHRAQEIFAEYQSVLRPTSRLPGILMNAWHAWRFVQLNAEIDALFSMLFGAHQSAAIEFLDVRATDAGLAQAKLNFLLDLILITRHNEDRLQFCPA